MKNATNWDANGCYADHDANRPPADANAWWEEKDDYMKKNNLPVTTRKVTDMKEVQEEIDKGQVVEIIETWRYYNKKTNKWSRSGHATALVGITPLKNGRYSLDIIDDSNQSDPCTGCGSRPYIYDPNNYDPNDPNSGEFDDNGFVSKFANSMCLPPTASVSFSSLTSWSPRTSTATVPSSVE